MCFRHLSIFNKVEAVNIEILVTFVGDLLVLEEIQGSVNWPA